MLLERQRPAAESAGQSGEITGSFVAAPEQAETDVEFDFSQDEFRAYLDEVGSYTLPESVDPNLLKAKIAAGVDKYIAEEVEPEVCKWTSEHHKPVVDLAMDIAPLRGEAPPYDFVDTLYDPEDPSYFLAVGSWINGEVHQDVYVVLVGEMGGMDIDLADSLQGHIERGEKEGLALYANSVLKSPPEDNLERAQPIFKVLSAEYPHAPATLGKLVVPTLVISDTEKTLAEEFASTHARQDNAA